MSSSALDDGGGVCEGERGSSCFRYTASSERAGHGGCSGGGERRSSTSPWSQLMHVCVWGEVKESSQNLAVVAVDARVVDREPLELLPVHGIQRIRRTADVVLPLPLNLLPPPTPLPFNLPPLQRIRRTADVHTANRRGVLTHTKAVCADTPRQEAVLSPAAWQAWRRPQARLPP